MLRLITLTTFPRLETDHLLRRQIQRSDAEALFVMFSDEVFYGGMLHHPAEESIDLTRRQKHWTNAR